MAQFVEAMRYKPEVAGPISNGIIGIFVRLIFTVSLGSTQPLKT
jgi:hypothetical protein